VWQKKKKKKEEDNGDGSNLAVAEKDDQMGR